MSRAVSSPVRRCSRSRKSSSLGRGNFGASPNPPAPLIEVGREFVHRGVEHAGRRDDRVAAALAQRSQAFDDGGRGLEDLGRSACQTRATSSSTSMKPGRPHRDVGGK